MNLLDARLGFIGVGNIANALITGLCSSATPPRHVTLSPRGAATAKALASRFAMVQVADSNQAVLDASDCVFLAVRPQVARETLGALRFDASHRIVSLIAILPLPQLATLVAPAHVLSRALPIPSVAKQLGPIAFMPPDPDLHALLATTGTPVPMNDDHQFETMWSLTALIASYFTLVGTAASWATSQGVPRAEAERYATTMFHGIASPLANPAANPGELAAEAQTKGGLNEQILCELTAAGSFDQVRAALDRVLARLEAK